MYLYVNDSFQHEEHVKISPFDHGFLYGLGLFETFRTYKGHPFLLDDHFERLHEGAVTMNMKHSLYDQRKMMGVVHELLSLNNLEDGYIRWNLSAGERGIGLSNALYENPLTIVYAKPLPKKLAVEKSGKTLQTRRNSPEGANRLKSHHYFNNILGKQELGDNNDQEGIFLTQEGFLSEGIVSNLFWVKSGQLYTPDLSCDCLNGVTRQFILALAEKEGIPIQEGRFTRREALLADEVMVTNSIQEIVPLNSWDGSVFPGKSGIYFQFLSEKYEKYTTLLWSKSELKN